MKIAEKMINARWVLPIAPENIILENHSIILNGQRIEAILPTAKASKDYKAKETIELANHVVLPGLINAHTHSPMNLFRGLADDLPLMEWLTKHIWPAEADIINEESVTDGAKLAIAEMLRGGTTCFNDMYFFPNETANAAIELGIRACVGHTIMNVPTGWAKDEDDYIQKARKAYQNRPQHPLISWSIAPHASYTNSDSSLIKAKELQQEFNLIMNMHVHETIAEINIDLERCNKRALQRLHDLRLLDDKFIAVHMVHLLDEEIRLIQQAGINIIHCPESNLKLASGFAPIAKFLNAGVNVALGTDGAASNNDLDMFGEMRQAAFIAKAINKDPTALPAKKALELATINGAKALGIANKVGSLEVGKDADIIAVDLSSYLTQPIFNPISHLVYATNRLQVTEVWIAGKQLLAKGEFTELDITKVLAKTEKWRTRLLPYRSSASTMDVITT